MINMNDAELRCFIAVAETLSFTKAAKQLYYSVPTVTHHISMLEQELGIKLFVRTKKSVSLTREGSIFYTGAKQMLEQENLILRNLKEKKDRRLFRIGCSSDAEAICLASFCKKIKESYPDMIPEVMIEDNTTIGRLFETDALEFALGCPETAKDYNLSFYELRREYMYAEINEKNPFAELDGIRFQDICSQPLLLMDYPMLPCLENSLMIDYLYHHAEQYHDMLVDNETEALPLVIADYGILILPEYRVIPNIRQFGIKPVQIEDLSTFSYGLMYRPGLDEDLTKFVTDNMTELSESRYEQLVSGAH